MRFGSPSSCSWTPAAAPDEILRLRSDCLARDSDGAAMLVYDNHKRDRRDRRLPISQATADLITV